MSGDPTASEVQRELDRFRQDARDAFMEMRTEMRTDLSTLKARVVFSDVYAADERRRDDGIAAIKEDLKDLKDAIEKDRSAAKSWRSNRDANRKWMIAAVIVPLGIAAAELISALRGVHW